MSDIELIVVGGVVIGAAYEAMKAQAAPPPDTTSYTSAPTAGSTTGDQIGDNASGSPGGTTSIGPPSYKNFASKLKLGGIQGVSTGSIVGTGGLLGGFSVGNNNPSALGAGLDSDTQAKIDQVNSSCQTFWDQASDAVKMKAAAELNTDFQLNPPLTGKESWSELSERCAAAAGRLGGQALGGAIAGPAGTYIGGMCGALLGGKVGDWVNENAQGVYDWCKDKLKGLGCDIGDLAESVWNDTLGAIF